MPKVHRRHALKVLTRPRLYELARGFELRATSRTKKDELIEVLARSKRAGYPVLLETLRADELKKICQAHGLDHKGKKAQLIDRILGRKAGNGQAEVAAESAQGQRSDKCGRKARARSNQPNGRDDRAFKPRPQHLTTPPRPSEFRSALQVSRERIAHMSDSDLSELMADLLRAQAYRCRSPRSELRVNTEDKAADGGCDAWSAKPEINDEWLGDAETCWQLKAGTAGEPGRLAGEVLKRVPMETLQSRGRFVVIASGSTSGREGETRRLENLRNEAARDGIPTSKIEVIGSERLADWCNQNPAVAARWAGQPEGLWTLGDWSSSEEHQVPWQASESIQAELAKQRLALEFEGGSVQHLHIYGHPGVGKTRFALELCRDAPWSVFVIYVRQAQDTRLIPLIDGCATDPGVRLTVVADEVQPDQLLPLRDAISRSDGRIRLITIGHCPSPEPSRIPALIVRPLGREMARNVIKGWYPAMPTEHIDFVVRFADGYVRLARLAADAIARDMSMDTRGLLSQEEIRIFLDGMLGEGNRRALYVVAVLGSVGWSDDKLHEGETIARHLNLDWNAVRADVEDYHRRFGIAPRGGRYRYISPTPLGIHLAAEAWTIFPDELRSLPGVLPTEEAKDAYYERLRSIASNPQARDYARQELAFFSRLDDFIDPLGARRWSALSSADPEQAAQTIVRVLDKSTVEERVKLEDGDRREIVWGLVRLASRPGSFADAVKALALLGEAENESWANNSTAEFIGRFQIFLGGTAVPYLDRLSVLDELATKRRVALTRLVVKALALAGASHASRMESGPASDELPDIEWNPSTEKEHRECVRAALHRLTALASGGAPELQDDFISAARDMAMLLRARKARPLVARLFDAIHATYPEAREPLRREIASIIHRERKYWKNLTEEDIAELDALREHFEDASLRARLRKDVGQSYWERDEEPDLRPLAKQLLDCPTALPNEWPWLISGDAADAWRFGEALAEEDTNQTLTDQVQELQSTGRDFRVVCGYVSTWRRKLGDEWYDEWFMSRFYRDPRPVHLLFEVAGRCGATPKIVHRIVGMLQAQPVSPECVQWLGVGKLENELESSCLMSLLRTMLDSGHGSTAMMILIRQIKKSADDVERWSDLALDLITAPEIIRSHLTTNYYWKEMALRYIDKHAARIARAIIREQGNRSVGSWFAEHSEAARILLACVERDAAAVWEALLPQLSSKGNAYRFSVGFPHGVIESIPPDQVLAWVDEQPEERACIIAYLGVDDVSNDDTLAARILGAYGDNRDVANAFFGEYISGSWVGPASRHWAQLAASARKVVERTKLPRLREWARNSARSLKEMAERDEQREQEEDLRGR